MDRAKRPSALAATKTLPPQPRVELVGDRVTAVLPTGDAVEILLYGATVISWRGPAGASGSESGSERLWLSDAARLDGTKAVRGGIPVVFPVFGKAADPASAAGRLPQHGLARTSRWEFLGKTTAEATSSKGPGVPSSSKTLAAAAAAASSSSSSTGATAAAAPGGIQLDFGLSAATADPALRDLWPYSFNLIYSVTLEPDRLTTSMVVTNDGDKAFDFQVLLHTYLRVGDISAVEVTGLGGAPYKDKVEGMAAKTQAEGSVVTITGETDRVYSPAGGAAAPVTVLEGGALRYAVARDNLADVVVWNPGEKAKTIGDFEPKDGVRHMLCVEPGAVSSWTTLEPGDAFECAQTITAH